MRENGSPEPKFLTDDDYPERNETPAPMDPPPALVSALQGIARGVPSHSHGGNIADAMESSAPIHAYTVPLTSEADVAMASVRREATALLRSHRGTFATALFGSVGQMSSMRPMPCPKMAVVTF
jgi:hypothetical protein